MPSSLRPLLALRLAARGLRRDPGPTVLAVAILALGMALPATFFSFLVGAVRPLPVPDGEQVVRVDVLQPRRDGAPLGVRPDELAGLQGVAGVGALGGFRTFAGVLVDEGRAATRIAAAAVTPQVLPLLRVDPLLGRLPAEAEDGALLLGERVWRELYEADPGVLGRSVLLDGERRTVVGVMPEGFRFPFNEEAWVPVESTAALPAGEEPATLELVGRLETGAAPGAVAAQLSARWSRGDLARSPERTGGRVRVDGFTADRGEGGEGMAFLGLVLIALCLLLIACANVANLLLVRASKRVRALGIQSALGAGRLQIGLQLLAESLLVAVLGGALGLLLAWGAIGAVERTLAGEHFGYFWMRLALDGSVVAFTAVLVLGTGLLAGILPVARVLAADVQRVLKEEGAGVGADGPWSRAFVTVQLALSCAALVAAGLTGGAMAAAADFGTPLPGEEILLASVETSSEGGPADPPALREALAALPGVREVAVGRGMPGFREPFGRFEFQDATYDRPRDRPVVQWNAVDPGYLALFGAEPVVGRSLTEADRAGGARVAVVSEGFVRRFSPDRPVLGRTLRIRDRSGSRTAWHTVVGVVREVELGGGEEARDERVYLPLREAGPVTVAVRTSGPAAERATALREALAGLGGGVPVWDVRTLADAHDYIVRVPRTLAALAVAGGLAGLLVAAVGLYGLLAFRVRSRRRELGVRLALGADAGRLARDVLRAALLQLVPAVVLGLGLAWLCSPVLSALRVGTDPRGAWTYAAVAAGFLMVGLLAALAPALRARSVEPARALRGE